MTTARKRDAASLRHVEGIRRSTLLLNLWALLALLGCAPSWAAAPAPGDDPFLDDLEARTFRFFWNTANPRNGLIPDRYPGPAVASIAAVGFGLTAYPIGV